MFNIYIRTCQEKIQHHWNLYIILGLKCVIIAGTCRFLCEVHKLEESPHDCEVTKTLESHCNQVSKQSDS